MGVLTGQIECERWCPQRTRLSPSTGEIEKNSRPKFNHTPPTPKCGTFCSSIATKLCSTNCACWTRSTIVLPVASPPNLRCKSVRRRPGSWLLIHSHMRAAYCAVLQCKLLLRSLLVPIDLKWSVNSVANASAHDALDACGTLVYVSSCHLRSATQRQRVQWLCDDCLRQPAATLLLAEHDAAQEHLFNWSVWLTRAVWWLWW